jgi:3-hydroxyacyl-CoA dehydrogenase
MGELVAGDADLVGGQAIEHEGVIGVGTMGDGDFAYFGRVGGCGILITHGKQRPFDE